MPDLTELHNFFKGALDQIHYDRFLSFERGKKWNPSIADPEIALPHFAR